MRHRWPDPFRGARCDMIDWGFFRSAPNQIARLAKGLTRQTKVVGRLLTACGLFGNVYIRKSCTVAFSSVQQ